MKLRIFGLLIFFIVGSCAVDKVNLSPTSNFFSGVITETPQKLSEAIEASISFTKYSSEITNSFSTLINFSKKEVNKELSLMKFYVSEYIYASQEGNKVGEERAIQQYKESYKKLQKLKLKLPYDEQELLNRFLVKIKTNISLIGLSK